MSLHTEETYIDTCDQKVTLRDLMRDMFIENKRFAIIYALFLLLVPVKDILFPRIMGHLYQNVSSENQVERSLLILLIFIVFMQAHWVITDVMEARVFPIIQKHVVEKVTRYVFDYYTDHANPQETSTVIRSLTKLPSHVYSLVIQIKFAIIPCMLSLAGILIYFFFKDLFLFALFAVIIALLVFVIRYSNRKCTRVNQVCDEQGTTLFQGINDSMKNLGTVAVYDTRAQEMDRIGKTFHTFTEACQNTRKCMFGVKTIIAPIVVMFTVVSVWYVYAFRYKTKQWPASEIVALIILDLSLLSTVLQATNSTEEFYYQYNLVQSALRLFEHCKIPRKPYLEPAEVKQGIHAQEVAFSRIVAHPSMPDKKKKKDIFRNFTLTIPAQKTTLLMGPVGSGKSTFLQLILGVFEPQNGRIFIDGQDSLEWHRMHKKTMYFIPQTPILFDRTVRDNILYGIDNDPALADLSTKDMEDMIRAQDGGVRFLEKLPREGLNARVGADGSGVSGGQRQLIWMMKLLFFDPAYVIMDEPTASLDQESKELMLILLDSVVKKRGKTVLIVTHDPSLKEVVDHVVSIKDGEAV